MKEDEMNVLDTFSGIGGFSLAFQRAGASIVAHSEIDKQASKVLHKQFPATPNLGDIRHVTPEAIPASVDLVCGGTPCQNLSIAGNRKGLAGEKSGLWYEYLRVVTELRPSWVFWENVPHALHSNQGRDFAAIIFSLGERGYKLAWRVLDAQYFGVPQRRRRLFVVGHFRDGRAANVLFERESGTGNFTQSSQAGKDAPTPLAGTLAASGAGTSRPAGQGNELDFLVSDNFAWDLTSISSPTNQSRVNGTVPTLTTNTRMYKGVRRFTPLECERLQGFPDGWTAGHSDAARYRMLGNSVAVPVVQWIAERIVKEDAL